MRLPQSQHSVFPSSRTFFTTVLLACGLMLALQVLASAQQLQCEPPNLHFGAIQVGQTESQTLILTNTGQTTVTISAAKFNGTEFSFPGMTLPMVLAAGQSTAVNVVFAPTSNGWTGQLLTFSSNASNPVLHVEIGGTGAIVDPMTSSPSSLSFGQVPVGTTATLSAQLKNSNTWKITLSGMNVVGAGISVSGPTFPLVVDSGQSVPIQVSFKPQSAGLISGSVFFTGPSLNIPLTGTGTSTGQLSATPTALNFGNVDVGNTATLNTTLSASGGSVTVSSATLSSSAFTISGVDLPFTVNAGQSVPLTIVFSPKNSGATNGTLTLASNASNPQLAESLAGDGVTVAYSVNLSWSPSTSSVVGYNVYRGTVAGSYSRINSSVDSSTSYTDNTVSSGVTYYYAATAVNSAGQESGYSSPIQVSVP
ncbi:MAG TPA: choice-of-anchor D domain-containing protein [Verrucomicrobiae bacterium]|jgi:Abnormal spindle-like microcephaly-assoc'd, ASPM-SPD-2-Hydin|nr:choice-of-anchor D domain-containing protein [Verrucomicrobiae bacterium]